MPISAGLAAFSWLFVIAKAFVPIPGSVAYFGLVSVLVF